MPEKQIARTFVRLSTSYWSDDRGIYTKKSLRYLRRKGAKGKKRTLDYKGIPDSFNFIEEDVNCIGPKETLDLIRNLRDCDDGVYEVVFCSVSTDWETGYVDMYEYKLIPYETV